MENPTERNYDDLQRAYDFFNAELFGGELPYCLITLQRKSKAYGFFWGERFGTSDGSEIVDEIALNPSHFKKRTTEAVLSTLVHEMVHLWQHHFGKPSPAHHNLDCAAKMESVGLVPSTTGAPGGKRIGQQCSHYIDPAGPFAAVCADLVDDGFTIPYVERINDTVENAKKRSRQSKTKFECPECGAKAWGKPDLSIVCGPCDVPMVAG